MSKMQTTTPEIRLYGVVTSEPPFDGEEIISPKVLAAQLEAIGQTDRLVIHLNSPGGDAYTGIAIYNTLKAMPCQKEIVVDGLAASAASLILCAADKVTVTPSSIVMIHGASMGLFGMYKADELDKKAEAAETVNKSMLKIYQAKTGKDEAELKAMIAEETWLVGQEIIDAGFADELIEEDGPVARAYIAGGKILLSVKNKVFDMSDAKNIPSVLLKAKAAEEEEKKKPEDPEEDDRDEKEEDEEDEKKNPFAKTDKKKCAAESDDTKKKAAAETLELIQAAVNAERKRIEEINSIAASITDKQMLADAMFNPKKLCDAKELAFRQLQADAKNGKAYLKAMDKDYKESGMEEVEPAAVQLEAPSATDTAAALLVNAAKNYKRG